jgi:integrase
MTSRLYAISTPTEFDTVEEELAKDVWDVRHLPGMHYRVHASDHLINFTGVSMPFRTPLKRHLRFMLAQRYSWSQCARRVRFVRLFLEFYLTRYSSVCTFRDLNRSDMEAYLLYLKTGSNSYGKPNSQRQIWEAVHHLKAILEYLERTSSPEAPLTTVGKLIWPEDGGVKPPQIYSEEKYIPESVLYQLEQHMHQLSPQHLPIVIILRASGWRIGDVLNLRHDMCLERTSSGWWLCGDIVKTEVLNHKVPLSEEIAAIVAAQCELVKEAFSSDDNPDRYLFPSFQQRRKGRPICAQTILRAINRMAKACEIKKDDGHLFHFKNHAFRHTKAVELINAGMSLVHVQKWLAHLTPEMTLAYAKLLDSTVRKEWEQAFAKGAVRIDVAGRPKVVSTEQLNNEQELELEYIRHNLDAVRLADGYCFKPKKANCPTQDSPCYTCRHFCTTPDFLPQFEKQERELHELVELGKRAGSEIWVERNTQKLNRVLPLIQVLRKGDLHHPAGKAMREYTPAERTKRV